MIEKNKYSFFTIWLILIFIFAGSAYSQSTKLVTKSGSFHEDLILQKGDQQSVELRQEGEWQRAFIFQTGLGQAANVKQSGISNLAFIHQMLNVKVDSTQSAIVTQYGFDNILLIGQSGSHNATYLQSGTGNTLFYYQQSDSLNGESSEVNIKQKGNGNRATVSQN